MSAAHCARDTRSFSAKRWLLGSLQKTGEPLGCWNPLCFWPLPHHRRRSQSPCRWTRGWFGTLLLSVQAGSRHAHGLRCWWLQGPDSPDRGRPGSSCKLVKAEGQWVGPSFSLSGCICLSGSTGKKISVQSCEFLLQAGWEAAR